MILHVSAKLLVPYDDAAIALTLTGDSGCVDISNVDATVSPGEPPFAYNTVWMQLVINHTGGVDVLSTTATVGATLSVDAWTAPTVNASDYRALTEASYTTEPCTCATAASGVAALWVAVLWLHHASLDVTCECW